MSKPVRIALYGGTFDPVHDGHLAIARAAWEKLDLEKVIFLPAFRSPHKKEVESTSGAHRAAMLELALKDEPWAEVSTWELEQEGPSYSWKTAEYFTEEWKERGDEFELLWILGFDQWDALPRWSRPDRLAELLHFVVFPRNGESPEEREGFRMTALSQTHPASGTAIRNALRVAKKPVGLSKSVGAYIQKNGLYGADEENPL